MRKNAALFLKLVIIGALSVVILIALFLVDNVISERQNYRAEAVKSISASYASEQNILGPVFVQPYHETVDEETTDDKGEKKHKLRGVDSTITIYPKDLSVKGVVNPSVRRHGLYRVPVYEFQGTLIGHIDAPPPQVHGDRQFGIPYLAIAVEDARGIVGRPAVRINGEPFTVQGASLSPEERDGSIHADIPWKANLRTPLPALSGKAASLDFAVDLTLGGTEKLDLVPVADSNRFELSSPWSAPLFAGQFLPRTREISGAGFHAVWEISSLASATQQQMTAHAESIDAVSVSLADTIDPYRLSDRTVKYGILFVLLTFGGFFLFEIIKQMRIHPVQYLLVGFCLAVFFLLLISFSEHMSFGLAYLIASAACIGVITYYLMFVLKSATYGLAFGGILATLYAAIYGLLVSEDNALLLGSLLLFGLIAMVMIATRKIDWYARTADPEPAPPAPYGPFTARPAAGVAEPVPPAGT